MAVDGVGSSDFFFAPKQWLLGISPISDGGDVRAPTPDHHRSL